MVLILMNTKPELLLHFFALLSGDESSRELSRNMRFCINIYGGIGVCRGKFHPNSCIPSLVGFFSLYSKSRCFRWFTIRTWFWRPRDLVCVSFGTGVWNNAFFFAGCNEWFGVVLVVDCKSLIYGCLTSLMNVAWLTRRKINS